MDGRAPLRQVWVNRPCLTMNEPDGVPDHMIEVSEVHVFARFIEAECAANRQTGAACGILLVRTLHMLK